MIWHCQKFYFPQIFFFFFFSSFLSLPFLQTLWLFPPPTGGGEYRTIYRPAYINTSWSVCCSASQFVHHNLVIKALYCVFYVSEHQTNFGVNSKFKGLFKKWVSFCSSVCPTYDKVLTHATLQRVGLTTLFLWQLGKPCCALSAREDQIVKGGGKGVKERRALTWI